MVELVKTSVPGYKKDKKHNVIINTDIRQYQDYVAQRNKSKQFNEMKDELAVLKEQMAALLQKVNNT